MSCSLLLKKPTERNDFIYNYIGSMSISPRILDVNKFSGTWCVSTYVMKFHWILLG